MKVKKTYGKQKTALTADVLPRTSVKNETLDENNWRDEKDLEFDRLLLDDKKLDFHDQLSHFQLNNMLDSLLALRRFRKNG